MLSFLINSGFSYHLITMLLFPLIPQSLTPGLGLPSLGLAPNIPRYLFGFNTVIKRMEL